MSNLTYRFNEIMSAVALAGDSVKDDISVNLPNLTNDLHEAELFGAIMCQVFKIEDKEELSDTAEKLAHLIVNSIFTKIKDDKPMEDDDLYGLSLVIHLAWGTGHTPMLFNTFGFMAQICGTSHLTPPDIASYVFRGNKDVERLGNLDPYKMLNKEYTMKDMFQTTRPEVPEQEIDDIVRAIEEELG